MNLQKLNQITIQQLESLLQLIEARSFTRAAKKIGVSQPALTKHIKNIENTIGIPIVIRDKAGISVTPEGYLLCEYAKKIVGLREHLKEKLIKTFNDESGNIEVIGSTIPATYILPQLLSQFIKDNPNIRVFIKNANSDESIDAILNEQSEIGFIGKKIIHKKIYAEPIWKDRLILAVPPHLAEKSFISVNKMMRLPFILREKGSGTRQVIEEYIQKKTGNNPTFNVIAEFGSSESIKEAILAGIGVSIISIHAIRRELSQKLIIEQPIENWKIERDFFLIHLKKKSLMRHHEIFLDFIKQTTRHNE